ncbi:MAG: energy transducer TonB [Acidobacteriota bacterium]
MHRTITSSVLLSSLLLTVAANASPPPAPAPALRVSTGVTPPQPLNSISLIAPAEFAGLSVPIGTSIVVSFLVDETGHPRDIRIVKGYNVMWNLRAAQAVQHLRYLPAQMDNQAIPMRMDLAIAVHK